MICIKEISNFLAIPSSLSLISNQTVTKLKSLSFVTLIYIRVGLPLYMNIIYVDQKQNNLKWMYNHFKIVSFARVRIVCLPVCPGSLKRTYAHEDVLSRRLAGGKKLKIRKVGSTIQQMSSIGGFIIVCVSFVFTYSNSLERPPPTSLPYL